MALPLPEVLAMNYAILAAQGLAGAAALGSIVGAAVWVWKHWRLLFLPLFTRLLRPRLLEQPVRSEIHALVEGSPGIHHSGIARRLSLGEGQALYHLGVLTREGLLSRVDTKGRRHYFVRGRFSPSTMQAMAELNLPASRRVFDAIRHGPGRSVRTVARDLGVSASRVSRLSRRLESAGLIRAETAGRERRLFPLSPPEVFGAPTFRAFSEAPVVSRATLVPIVPDAGQA